MKILITGHKGFIGSHLYDRLTPAVEKIGLDLKDGHDILDESLTLPDADVVIHLAALADVIDSIKEPAHNALTNIVGTVRLANHYKYRRFIFISTGGAIEGQSRAESPYGLSKVCAEEYVKMLCPNHVILRLANVYGPGESRSVVDIFKHSNELFIYGDGTQTRTYVHVDDVVTAIISSIDWPIGRYSIGTGHSHSIHELVANAGKDMVRYRPRRVGELQNSLVPNHTDGRWQPTHDVLAYLRNA